MLIKFAFGLVDSLHDVSIFLLELHEQPLPLNKFVLLILPLHKSEFLLLAPADPCRILLDVIHIHFI